MYIDSYLIAVPEHNKSVYIEAARRFAEIAKDYGVTEIVENWEVDVPDGKTTDYRKAVKAEPGERIVSSWMIWPDRDAAKKAHEAMTNDPRMEQLSNIPFDGKRMVIGGFEHIFTYGRSD